MEQTPMQPSTGPGPGGLSPPAPQVAYILKPRPRWRALRVIASILKVLAWLTAGCGVIAVFVALIIGIQTGSHGLLLGLAYGVATLIGSASVSLLLYSRAEQMLLLIAIEQNTRKL